MINDAFRHVIKNLDLWSFYETLETSIGLRSTIIVKRDSAVLGYPGEHVGMIHADHRGVCKFKLPSDPNYLTVRNCFATIIDRITKKCALLKNAMSNHCLTIAQCHLERSRSRERKCGSWSLIWVYRKRRKMT
jgi:hypothetical protein